MVLDEGKQQKIQNARVLVVGDCMLDQYWVGDVDRISPEAPVPIVRVTDEQQRLGAAANVATNIADFSAHATLISVIGDDATGQDVLKLLKQNKIKSSVQVDIGYKTTVKVRLIARNQQIVRADFESVPSSKALDACLQQYYEVLEKADVVLVSDYGKGGAQYIKQMIQAARVQLKPIYIDPKGDDYSLYQGASLITPNLSEFQQVAGHVVSLEEINNAAQKLIKKLDIEACLITLSERGMLLCRKDKPSIHQINHASEVFDVTGAGDTVIAMMAIGRAANLDWKMSMTVANHAAGIVISKIGTATASLDEVLTSMNNTGQI